MAEKQRRFEEREPGFADSLIHGFQSSITGLRFRGQLPDRMSGTALKNMSFLDRELYGLGQFSGDLP